MKKRRRRLQKSDVFWLLAAALLILLQFWWLPGDPGTPDDSYSNAVDGKRGLYQTLDALSKAGAFPEVRRETARLIPEAPATLLLLSPDRYPNIHEQEELSDFVYRGGTLLFAPNWTDPECTISQLSIRTTDEFFVDEDVTIARPTTPPATTGSPAESLPAEAEDPEPESSVASNEPDSLTKQSTGTPPVTTEETQTETTDLEERIDDELETTPGVLPNQTETLIVEDADANVRISNLQTESELIKGSVRWRTRASMNSPGSRAKTLVTTSQGTIQAAAWTYGDGLVVVSASPDVFSNQALLFEDQAELAIRLVEHAHAHHAEMGRTNVPIIVNEFMNSSNAYRGVSVLMSPSLRSGTLQLILAAFLCGWFGFHRFGPAIKTNVSERRSLTDSAVAVGNLQFRSQGSADSVRSYVEYLKSRIKHLFSGTVRLEDYEALAHRTGLTADDVAQRVNEAQVLIETRGSNPGRAAAAIRRLADLHRRLTGINDKPSNQTQG